MPSMDTESVIELAQEMLVWQDRVATLRLDLFNDENGLNLQPGMYYLGGDGAPWGGELKESWNSVVAARSAEADTVDDITEKIRMNLLTAAAVQKIADGESAAEFADTGLSLEEIASGDHFEDW